RPPGDRDEDLPRSFLLHLASLLEGLLVEHADHVPGALVDDDLFLPELLARRRHPIAAAELRERDLEDAAQEIAEGIPGVSLRRRLGPPALRAHPVRRRGIGPAMDALVSETLRHVDRRLLRIDQVPLGAREAALVRQHLVSLLHLDEGALRVLGVVVAPGPDDDAGGLLRDRAHLGPDDGVHVHFRGDVEDPLRDDAVEDDRTGLLRGLQGLHEVPDGDFGDDAVPLIEEARRGRTSELEEHLAILLQLRVEDLRGRREWRGCDLSELPWLATGLGPWFRAGLRASLGTAGRRR